MIAPGRESPILRRFQDSRHANRFLPHQAAAALHLRGSEPPQGAGARPGRGHHRFRHGQSRHADARLSSSTSCARRRAIRAPTAIPPRAASRACARPMSPITSAASASSWTPTREVIAALGSKEGFANLAMAITAPGDVVLVPNPAYPIHAFGFMIAGAAIRHVPATSPEEYLSKIGVATRHSVPSPLAHGGELSVQSHGAGGRIWISTKRSSSSPRSTRSGC